MCRWGFFSVKKVLQDVADDRTRAYIVWLPIFGGDFHGEARKLSKGFPDKRVAYFTDSESLTGEAWERVLQTGRSIAWDVYFLYSPTAQWEKDPPPPDFWMHQLTGVTKGPRFDAAEFKSKLKEMVNALQKEGATESNGVGTQAKSKRMKVEFLYFKSCPSHKQALANLKAALREKRIKADLILINVDSPEKAEKTGFQGSPSIRINGKDLEGRDQEATYSCRLYTVNGKPTLVPGKEYIAERLAAHQ